jgi:hypothetical protein
MADIAGAEVLLQWQAETSAMNFLNMGDAIHLMGI